MTTNHKGVTLWGVLTLFCASEASAWIDMHCRKTFIGYETLEVVFEWSSVEEDEFPFGAMSSFADGPGSFDAGGSWGWDTADYGGEFTVIYIANPPPLVPGAYKLSGSATLFNLVLVNGQWTYEFHPNGPQTCTPNPSTFTIGG